MRDTAIADGGKPEEDSELLLDGNKVVVIGGSSGIGLAIACQARVHGASLVIVGRDPVKLSDAASKLGGDVQSIVGDAHDHAALEKLIAAYLSTTILSR